MVLAIITVRLGLPLLIPRFPVPAVLGCLVVDAADQTILQRTTDLTLDGYQGYDKALDVYYLSVAYLSTLRNWTDPAAFGVGRFLWYYRLVGVAAFELTGARALLLVFANTFEYFFLAYEGVRTRWDPRRLGRRTLVGLAAFIWIVIKLPQEWWIHVAQLDFTDVMKEDVLGVTVDTPWGEALAENLWFVGLALAVVVVLALVWRRQRSRLPAADWPFTLDVDRHLDGPAATSVPPPWWSAALAEKVVLVGLLGVVFASVLPDLDRGPVQTAVAVAVLVMVASGVGEVLGPRWSSLPVRIPLLAVVNLLVIGTFATVGRNPGEERNEAVVVFLAVLVALQVALYDRYRSTRPVAAVSGGPPTASTG